MDKKNNTYFHTTARNIFWFSYSGIIAIACIANTYHFFSMKSPIPLYFQILYYFNPIHFINYFINFIQTILSAIHFIPMILYIIKVPSFNKTFWKALFILRIIFDIFGHSYEKIQIISLYQENPNYFYVAALSSFLIHLPSYFACFHYAFNKEKATGPTL